MVMHAHNASALCAEAERSQLGQPWLHTQPLSQKFKIKKKSEDSTASQYLTMSASITFLHLKGRRMRTLSRMVLL